MFCSYRISTDKLSRGPSAIAEPLVCKVRLPLTYPTLLNCVLRGFIYLKIYWYFPLKLWAKLLTWQMWPTHIHQAHPPSPSVINKQLVSLLLTTLHLATVDMAKSYQQLTNSCRLLIMLSHSTSSFVYNMMGEWTWHNASSAERCIKYRSRLSLAAVWSRRQW